MANKWDLDAPLLRLSSADSFTLRDACAGVHVFGAIGSGKTSGSGKALASAYLRAGMGGVVACAKPEEVELWLRYAAENGRSNSVILFDERQGFNFLTYELARQGMTGIGSVVKCLMRILEAVRLSSPTASGGSGDQFWTDAVEQLLMNALPVLYAAYGQVSVGDILHFVTTAATSGEQLADEDFKATNFAYTTMKQASVRPRIPLAKSTMDTIARYWFNEFTRIPEKTRGNILITLSTMLGRFNHGRLHNAFCGKTTVVPDLTLNGAIIILAMPTLTWNEDGIIAQQLFKYMWERMVESRNAMAPQFRERPVFLWMDEAQNFVNSYDASFLSTCRGSRACLVFLTQNLPTYYARLGGNSPHVADELIGKFNTHIFHQNACAKTNEFASHLIGRGIQRRQNYSEGQGTNRNMGMNKGDSSNSGWSTGGGTSHSDRGGSSYNSNSGRTGGSGSNWGDNRGVGTNSSTSWGYSETMDFLVEPAVFARDLKSGGPRNGNKVTAVWYKTGGNFRAAGGDNVLFATFSQ